MGSLSDQSGASPNMISSRRYCEGETGNGQPEFHVPLSSDLELKGHAVWFVEILVPCMEQCLNVACRKKRSPPNDNAQIFQNWQEAYQQALFVALRGCLKHAFLCFICIMYE